MDVLERILGKKIIAIIRGFKLDETLKTADAVAAGGLGLLEVPFDQRRPLAYTTDKIKALADRYQDGQVLVGAGTVLTVGQVRAASVQAHLSSFHISLATIFSFIFMYLHSKDL